MRLALVSRKSIDQLARAGIFLVQRGKNNPPVQKG